MKFNIRKTYLRNTISVLFFAVAFSGMSANLSAQIEPPVRVEPPPVIDFPKPLPPMTDTTTTSTNTTTLQVSPAASPVAVQASGSPPSGDPEPSERAECHVVREQCQQVCYPLPSDYSTYEKCIEGVCREVEEDCLTDLIRHFEWQKREDNRKNTNR